MSRAYRTVFAIVGIAALVLQYVLMIRGPVGPAFVPRTINFFSYFTILTNILVALALAAPAFAPDSRLGRWTRSEGVRAALAMYIAVVGLTYHFLLANVWNPQGLNYLANVTLHYVMPVVFVLDWVLFTPKGRLRWIDPAKWLAFPLIYGVWVTIYGLISGWYPYWFVNISDLGFARAAVNFGGLLAFFFGVGLVVVGLDRLLGGREPVAS